MSSDTTGDITWDTDPAVVVQGPAEPALAWECTQTVLRFTASFDAGELDEMKSWFAPEGRWVRPVGIIEGYSGIDDFAATIAPGTVMRHVITNTRVDRLADGGVGTKSYFTVYLKKPDVDASAALTPNAVGRYHDKLIQRDGRWIIVERVVRFDII